MQIMKMHFVVVVNGHINIAQWLYELSIKNNQPINIHANNEEAFLGVVQMVILK